MNRLASFPSPVARLWLSLATMMLLTILSLLAGRYPQPGFTNPMDIPSDPLLTRILLDVRLPRVLLALSGGASLAAAGFVFQMLFANPLVEPGFLGVSQGAAFGAAGAMVFLGSVPAVVQISAMSGGLLALFLSGRIARSFRFGGWILRLVLAGITVGAMFSAGLSIIKLVADPATSLQDITFWMMGGLWNSSWQTAWSVLPSMWIALAVMYLVRWRVNILSLEDRSAHSVGILVGREKTVVLFIATVATTSIVSVAGLVGWVGLIIPHLARRLYGSDARFALPGSMVLGSSFLLLCDTIGRVALGGEIPLGVMTSLFGAAIFIIILTRKQSEVKL